MIRSNLLENVVHSLQSGLTESVDLRSWDISEIDCPTNLTFEVLGFRSPLVRLKQSPG